jgi:hypothetical protein
MDTNHSAKLDDQIQADLQAVLDRALTAKPLDPAVEGRVQKRAEKIRQEVLTKHGVVNVAVDLIREGRDEAIEL